MLIPKGSALTAPGPVRFDQAKGARIVLLPNGQEEVTPYIELPILLVKNSDDLLDDVSRANGRKVAA